MGGQYRKDIRPGLRVAMALAPTRSVIVRKQDQRTGRRTAGVVKDILTSAPRHTRGIKVRLTDGQIGRVQEVEPADETGEANQPGEGGERAG
jgi:uncharacterized repeat protein (TIGR03833 family)